MGVQVRFWQLIQFIIISLLLAGCGGGAVRFAPTPLPPELNPTAYEHPSGAFKLVLPPNWSVFSQNLTTLASTAFAPPASDIPLIRISVVNLGYEIQANDMGELLLQYQTQIRPDLDRYTEQDRQSFPDGSWRLTGLRTLAGGNTQQVNSFIERKDSLFGVIDVIVPTDTAQRADIQRIINTFELLNADDLPVSDISALAISADSPLEVVNVSTWTTPNGVLYVTGEVTNHGAESVSSIPVRALQIDANGVGLVEAVDVVMGYTLRPETFLPFSLRFGQGQVEGAVKYGVIVGDDEWNPDDVTAIMSEELFDWTDESNFNDAGQLFINGEITNNSLETAKDTKIIVTVFDDQQNVIASAFHDVQPAIFEGGDTTDYNLLVPDVGGTPATYILTVQALPCGEDECS